MSGARIAQKLGIHRTTAYRILTVLEDEGFVKRDNRTGYYKMGPGFFALGSLYLNSVNLNTTAEPVIKTMNDLTNEAVSVSVFDSGNVIVVMKEESKQAFRYTVSIGSVIPAHASAMGKIFLSELDEDELNKYYPNEDLYPLTTQTIKTKTELKRELQETRETGLSFDAEGSFDGLEGISSVIKNRDGNTVAALSITVPVFRLDQNYRERIATLVSMGANIISYELGFQIPSSGLRDLEEMRSWWQEHY
jgi:IclR family pca regulon transcriptional regulator